MLAPLRAGRQTSAGRESGGNFGAHDLGILGRLCNRAAGIDGNCRFGYDDKFDDGVRGAQWASVVDDPGHLSLSEAGGHLRLISAGGGVSTNDALYLSNFKLSTASDFDVRISYTLTGSTGGELGDGLVLAFGVGRDLEGTDSAAIGTGYAKFVEGNTPFSRIGYRNDNSPETNSLVEGFTTRLSDQLEIAYTAATDTLTLSRVGGAPFSYSLPAGFVRTSSTGWQADSLYVSFGGRGSGISSTGDGLYLDNFTVVSGTIVPEPTLCLTAVSLVVGLGRRRLGRVV